MRWNWQQATCTVCKVEKQRRYQALYVRITLPDGKRSWERIGQICEGCFEELPGRKGVYVD